MTAREPLATTVATPSSALTSAAPAHDDSIQAAQVTFDVPRPLEPAAPAAPTPAASVRGTEADARFKGDEVSLEARLLRAQEHDELSRRLAPERPDPAWTASVEQRMHALLATNGVPVRALDAVDCRETICRLRLISEGVSQRAVMSVIHAARELHLETWLLPEEDPQSPRYHLDVFLPRDGYRLSGGGGRIGGELTTGEAPPAAEPVSDAAAGKDE
jgi:hypothetical protein